MRPSLRTLLTCSLVALLASCTPPTDPAKPASKADNAPVSERGLAAAEKLRREGNTGEALAMLKKLNEETPDDARVLSQLGYAQIEAEQPEDAVITFDRLIALDPKNPLAYNGKGVAFDHTGNHLAAQDLYQFAAKLAPDMPSIRNNLAMSFILNGQTEQAIALLEKLSRENPNNSVIRQNLALAYGIKGENAKASDINLKSMSKEEAEENQRFYELYNKAMNKPAPVANTAPVGFMTTPPLIAEQTRAKADAKETASAKTQETPPSTEKPDINKVMADKAKNGGDDQPAPEVVLSH